MRLFAIASCAAYCVKTRGWWNRSSPAGWESVEHLFGMRSLNWRVTASSSLRTVSGAWSWWLHPWIPKRLGNCGAWSEGSRPPQPVESTASHRKRGESWQMRWQRSTQSSDSSRALAWLIRTDISRYKASSTERWSSPAEGLASVRCMRPSDRELLDMKSPGHASREKHRESRSLNMTRSFERFVMAWSRLRVQPYYDIGLTRHIGPLP
jgi:hypothetical protein